MDEQRKAGVCRLAFVTTGLVPGREFRIIRRSLSGTVLPDVSNAFERWTVRSFGRTLTIWFSKRGPRRARAMIASSR
jgi:hypothetical protein